ncbi:dihydropteroate synthase [Nocardioides cynanchi]|uniref:dihydropteroate synthase n=1 Tax=Nocardioides cynanchi TaxID=2558918 RepID=UPI001EE361B9|nr:dihydropteroate synthase [Nocardioides cynanchi]
MISLEDLSALRERFATDLALPVTPVRLGDLVIADGAPVLMGTVNLSRASTYRESIAVSQESAIRKARVQVAEGAQVVDLGAESSTARAERVSADDQIAALVPVIEAIAAETVVSVETYEPAVVRKGLAAGAQILNMTGRQHEDEMFTLAAEYDAGVVLCFVEHDNVRDAGTVSMEADPMPHLVDHFGPRLARARELGVEQVVIDPGMGFYYANLVDPTARVRHQTRVLAQSFRLRSLGVPVCNALPHAFDLFEDEFRKAEGFFAMIAQLGGTHLFRTHEVAHVRAVLRAMGDLSVG